MKDDKETNRTFSLPTVLLNRVNVAAALLGVSAKTLAELMAERLLSVLQASVPREQVVNAKAAVSIPKRSQDPLGSGANVSTIALRLIRVSPLDDYAKALRTSTRWLLREWFTWDLNRLTAFDMPKSGMPMTIGNAIKALQKSPWSQEDL